MSDVDFYRPTLEEIEGDEPFNDAEKRVIEEMRHGGVNFSDVLPDDNAEEPCIRGPLIRHLMLGGCEKAQVSRAGVTILGATITGQLDFIGTQCTSDLALLNCKILSKPAFRDAKLKALYLDGSDCLGLDCSRMQTEGSVHLRNGFTARDRVDLKSTVIGGSLDCGAGYFDGSGSCAIDLHSAKIAADLFLVGGFNAVGEVKLDKLLLGGHLVCREAKFIADGAVALSASSAQIGGNVLLVEDSNFTGQVNFFRAIVAEDMICDGSVFQREKRDGVASRRGGLDLEAVQIGRTCNLRFVSKLQGQLVFTDAQIGCLRDEKDTYVDLESLLINGFRYDSLDSDMTPGQRIKWLAIKEEGKNRKTKHGNTMRDGFDPQPYSQLAKVYREQGASENAARILEARDNQIWHSTYRRIHAEIDGSWQAGVSSIIADFRYPGMWLFRWMFGYGHLPARALWWAVGLVAMTACFFHVSYINHQMVPASTQVLTSPEWIYAVETSDTPLLVWADSATSIGYPSFQPLYYAIDLLIPLNELGYKAAWTPASDRGWLGNLGSWIAPVVQLLGWMITSILAAALTGVIGRKD
ncbi:MAG: hypothetical protein HRU30_12480 [Rhodobacteraceae bacterium]|nr:hypothetical protein [Paracoccaceae bacterium]